MKPKPISSMQRPTCSGSSSMLTPSASSRSAEPHLLVLERLPCLATAQPAPAATSAAAVETLKVEGPPPVPAVSTRSGAAAGDRGRQRAHRPRQADQLGHGLALRPQRDQEGAGLDRVGPPLHDLREHRGGVIGGEVIAGADRVDRPADDVVGHHAPEVVADRQVRLRGSSPAGTCPAGSAPTRGGTGRPRPAARGGGRPSRRRRGWRSARARREGRGRRRASGSGRRRTGSAARRRSPCRRARPRRPCRGSARPGRPCRRRPRPSPGGRGRRRAPACRPRRRRGSPRRRSPPRPACRAPGRRPGGRRRARAARRPSALSLRTTSISAPSSPRYWTRL